MGRENFDLGRASSFYLRRENFNFWREGGYFVFLLRGENFNFWRGISLFFFGKKISIKRAGFSFFWEVRISIWEKGISFIFGKGDVRMSK